MGRGTRAVTRVAGVIPTIPAPTARTGSSSLLKRMNRGEDVSVVGEDETTWTAAALPRVAEDGDGEESAHGATRPLSVDAGEDRKDARPVAIATVAAFIAPRAVTQGVFSALLWQGKPHKWGCERRLSPVHRASGGGSPRSLAAGGAGMTHLLQRAH